MVEYQQRLNKEVEQVVSTQDGNEILDLLNDHLGMNSSKYMTRSAMLRELQQQDFPNALSDTTQEPKTHLKLELLLPIAG